MIHDFLFIFIHVIIPIFLQVAGGYTLQKKFKLDINTLSKIQMYLFIPALMFSKIYQSEVKESVFILIMLNCTLLFFLLYLIAFVVAKLFRFKKSQTTAFANSICLYNSGNYCIPLIQLLYNSPYALAIQIIIMMTQTVLTNTVGIFSSNIGNRSLKPALINTLKMPMIYIVALAILARAWQVPVGKPILSALDILGQGLVPLALVTLGAQLANTPFKLKIRKVYLSNFIRLIVSPVVAFLLVMVMGIRGIEAQVIIICSAAPTAVNSMLLALEYDNEPEFASQAILTSTLMSAMTVTAVIYFVTKTAFFI